MAFQATFTANLQPLEQAIAQATPTLNGFEQRTKQIGRSLQGMVSEFDGTKIIQQATLMIGAIDKIGGATRLTETEQRKVNASLEEALKKYAALGQTAPRALTDLYQATQRVEQKTKDAAASASLLGRGMSTIGTFATGAIAGVTLDRVVGAVTNYAKQAIAAGSAIHDLSIQTGLGTDALQRWQFAAEQNGNTLDQLAAASTRLSRHIVDGNDTAVSAFNRLGLSIDTLRSLGPEQAFEAVAAAIAKVPDPMERASLATAAFGRAGAEILPTLISDFKATGDEAERLGLVLSQTTITAIDNLGDSLDKLTLKGRGLLAQFVAPAAPLLDALATAALNATTRMEESSEMLARLALKSPAAGVFAAFARPLDAIPAALKLVGLAFEEVQAPLVKNTEATTSAVKAIGGLPLAVQPADAALSSMSRTIADQNRQIQRWQTSAEQLKRATDAWLGRDLIAKANELVAIYRATGRVLPATVEGQRQVNQALEAAGGIMARVTPDFAELYLRTLPAAVPVLQGVPKQLLEMGRTAEAIAPPVTELTKRLKELNDVRVGLPSTLPGWKFTIELPKPIDKGFATELGRLFGDHFLEGFSATLTQALASGGDVGLSLASFVTGSILESTLKAIQNGSATKGQKALAVGAAAVQAAIVGFQVSQQSESKLKGALAGGASGATQGFAVGGWVGAVVGGVGGLLGGLFGSSGSKVKDLRNQLIATAGSVEELKKQAFDAGFSIDRLLGARNTTQFNQALAEFQTAIRKTEEIVAKTIDRLGRIGEGGGFLGGDLAAQLLRFKDRPDVREALGAFLQGQGERTVGGLTTFLQNSQVSSAWSASSLEGALLAQFGQLTSQGASPLEALQQLGPAIELFGQKTQEVVGFQAGPAFQSLLNLVSLTKDEIAGPALTAVAGLGNVFVGLQNQGLLTQDMFGGLSRQLYDTFHGLELVGKGGVDAARGMQQPLQRTWELVKDFGYSVDEDTQRLLEFAESSGLIGEKFRPAEDKLSASIDRLTAQLGKLAEAMQTTLVSSAYTAAARIEDAFNGIQPGPIAIDVSVHGNVNDLLPGFAHGSGGLIDFGSGTVAVLHGREAVLTEAQLSALAASNGHGTTVQILLDSELVAARTFSAARRLIRMQGH